MIRLSSCRTGTLGQMRIAPVLLIAAALGLMLAPAGAGAAARRCTTSPTAGAPSHLYALRTTCRVADRVQRRYVRVIGDCGDHVCAFNAVGRDWVCHDRAHPGYLQIRCLADTDHSVRVGWRDAEY